MKAKNKKYFQTAFLFSILALMGWSCKEKKATDTIQSSQIKGMHSLKFSKAQIQLANIKTDTAKFKSISEEISLTGKLVFDENNTKVISSRINGRIDKLYFKSPGDFIKAGDVMYEIYSEELVAAQKEFLIAVEQQKRSGNTQSDFSSIVEALENKLILWGLTSKQIEKLHQTSSPALYVPIYSQHNAFIQEIIIREGDYVMEGVPVFRLSDNLSLWLEVQVFPNEMKYIREGKTVNIRIDAFSDRKLKGQISFINPETETNSKINLIRIELNNPSGEYKPGMLATILLKTNEKKAITLPADAVIQGAKKSLIWIQKADGSFEMRQVTTGMQTSDEIEITSGLHENEVVVTSGAYLINSEYILKNGSGAMEGMKM